MLKTFSTISFASLLSTYGYAALFPIAALEGPIVTMAGGFFVSLGLMNFYLVLLIVVAGDMTSDLFFYSLGWAARHWRPAHWLVTRFPAISGEERFRTIFAKYGGKMVIIGKLTHALAGIVFMGAGYAKISARIVMWYSFAGAVLKALLLIGLGYLAGAAYESMYRYFEYGSWALLILTLLILAAIFYAPKKLRFIGSDPKEIF